MPGTYSNAGCLAATRDPSPGHSRCRSEGLASARCVLCGHILTILTALVFVSLVACGTDATQPAKIANASEAQLDRIIETATNRDAETAIVLGVFATGGDPDGSTCPTVKRDPVGQAE